MRLIKSALPEWYEILPGIRIHALPLLSGLHEDAMQSLLDQGIVTRPSEDNEQGGLAVSETQFGVSWAKAVAERVIVEWEGVDDPDGTEPAQVTPDNIAAFIDHPLIYQRFGEVYMARFMLLSAEKNGSAPLPNSNSGKGATTAGSAPEFVRSARAS